MPSRATSAFQRTVQYTLHERAADYTMWVAGHGGDTTTLRSYLDALAVFPSHFEEWASNKNRTTLMESIPALRSLLPSLFSDRRAAQEPLQPIDPLPPAVSLVITLALQQYMMMKEFGSTGIITTLSGHHSPKTEAYIMADMIDALSKVIDTLSEGETDADL
jgi:hypothetical protein